MPASGGVTWTARLPPWAPFVPGAGWAGERCTGACGINCSVSVCLPGAGASGALVVPCVELPPAGLYVNSGTYHPSVCIASSGPVAAGSVQGEVHDVQADEAVRLRVEGCRHGADDPEPERLPQVHRRGVGLDDRVELDRAVAVVAVPLHDVLAQPAAPATATRGARDHERRGADVGAAAGPVGSHGGAAEDLAVL